MKTILPSVLMVLFLAVGPLNAQSIHISEELSFGREELIVHDSVTAGGDTFARISDLEVDEQYLYVLDNDLHKVAVFDKNSGNLVRIILGGYGRGPGEFRLPLSLTVTGDDQVAVYDYENRKIILFEKSGEHVDELVVPISTRSIAENGGQIWLAAMHQRNYFAFSLTPENFSSVDDLNNHIAVSDDDREYFHRSFTTFIDDIEQEEILVASHRPSMWYRIANGKQERFGREEHPELKPYRDSNGVYSRDVQTAGICHFNTNYVAILWEYKPPERSTNFSAIDFYTLEGIFIGREKLDPHVWPMTCDSESNYIYLVRHDPYPRVVKYRVDFDDAGN